MQIINRRNNSAYTRAFLLVSCFSIFQSAIAFSDLNKSSASPSTLRTSPSRRKSSNPSERQRQRLGSRLKDASVSTKFSIQDPNSKTDLPSRLTDTEILLLNLVKNIDHEYFLSEAEKQDDQKLAQRVVDGEKNLKTVFEGIDINKNDKLEYKELSLYFNYFSYNSSHTDIHKKFIEIDVNEDGFVDQSEIINSPNANGWELSSHMNRFEHVNISSNAGLLESEFAAFAKINLFPHLVEVVLREKLVTLHKDKRNDLLFYLLTRDAIDKETWDLMGLLPVSFDDINVNTNKGLTIEEIRNHIKLHVAESYEGQTLKALDTDRDDCISKKELYESEDTKKQFYQMVLTILRNAYTCENIFKKLNHAEMVSILKVLLVDGNEWQKSRTPLLYAASRGFKDVVIKILDEKRHEKKLVGLLEAAIDIQATDLSSNNAINLAVWEAQTEIIPLLLDADVSVNSKNQDNMTPLLYACLRNNAKAVAELVKSGQINVNFENNEGSTALTYAASYGNVEIIKLLLQRKEIQVNHMTKSGTNALMIATSWNKTDAVRELLKHEGIDCDLVNSKSKLSPIMYAAYHDLGEIVKIFAETNIRTKDTCNFDLKDKFGWTAYDIAYYRGSESVTKVFSEIEQLRYFADDISLQLQVKTFGVNRFHFYLIIFNFVLPLGALILILIWNKSYDDSQASEAEKEQRERAKQAEIQSSGH